MDPVQVYTTVTGLLLLVGTALTAVGLFRVRPSRKPLYMIKLAKGLLMSATFVLGYLIRFAQVSLPTNLFLGIYYLALFVVALSLIVDPLVDRYEAKKLSDGKP